MDNRKIFENMTTDLWRHLNLPTLGAIKEDFEFPEPKSGHGVHWKYTPSEVFDPIWYEKFRENIKFDGECTVILFFCEKNKTNAYAHIDINEKHNPVTMVPAAFNWTVGGAGSNMVWYNQYGFTKDDLWYGETSSDWSEKDPNRRAQHAAIWPVPNLDELAKFHVPSDHVTLVNTGIAHRIELGPEDRWCFSVRLPYKDTDTWQNYIDMANSLIV